MFLTRHGLSHRVGGDMSGTDDREYYSQRAAQERRIAAELPEGPAAVVHHKLAELYEKASGRSLNGCKTLHISTARRP